jgi:chemotaxis signal transduction protein
MNASKTAPDSLSVPVATPTQTMVFRSSEYYFGAPLSDVEEILTPMPLTAIPHSESYVIGMGYRGRFVFPVIDYYALITGTDPLPQRESTVYLLFRTKSGWTAVSVDSLVKIQSMPLHAARLESADKIADFATQFSMESEFAAAIIDVGAIEGRPLPVLNFPVLLEQALWAKKKAA